MDPFIIKKSSISGIRDYPLIEDKKQNVAKVSLLRFLMLRC